MLFPQGFLKTLRGRYRLYLLLLLFRFLRFEATLVLRRIIKVYFVQIMNGIFYGMIHLPIDDYFSVEILFARLF